MQLPIKYNTRRKVNIIYKNSRPGYSKCRTLEAKIKDIIAKNNIEAIFTKVEDFNEMMNYEIMMTPGSVINEQVKSFGIIPKDE